MHAEASHIATRALHPISGLFFSQSACFAAKALLDLLLHSSANYLVSNCTV
jgi:hypothetical protein